MAAYRLTKPVIGLPVGGDLVITIPVGSVVEVDPFLALVGLTVVHWNERRVTVTIQEIRESSKPVG